MDNLAGENSAKEKVKKKERNREPTHLAGQMGRGKEEMKA